MKTFVCIMLLAMITFSCQKELSYENIVSGLPTLTTLPVTSVTKNSAYSGGNISNIGGSPITAAGICWSISHNPDINGSQATLSAPIGIFAIHFTGLTATTTYYVRAYATNSSGTAYGDEVVFTTTNISTALPTVTTASTSGITKTTAISGGDVVTDGGATVTARGVCWSTVVDPTVALSTKTTDGSGMGVFTSAITGLTANTTYHVRAYATNSVGTFYGGDSVFTTSAIISIPTITTTAASAVTSSTASSGGTIITNGGAAVTARGVCWSTTPAPEVIGNHTTNGTGTGSFTSALTGLLPVTTYYIRAYATNGLGTAYGNEVSLTTPTPDVYVVGHEFNSSGKSVATIWKNGVASSLTSGATDANAYSIFVSGTDVYVAGRESNGSNMVAKVWKNGVGTALTSGPDDANAYSVFVAGTDVYVAGSQLSGPNYKATIWKNGVATYLTSGANSAEAYSVFVSGTDVYAGGYERNGAPGIAKVWKNGVVTNLTNGTFNAAVLSVFINGTDVYAGGNESNGTSTIAKTWKNGVATLLSNPATPFAVVQSVFVSGSDIYAAGEELTTSSNWVAKLWKNGVPTTLTAAATNSFGLSVYVSGTDVYVAGSEKSGTKYVAKIWKNGVATSLTSGTNDAEANSIFVQ
jgi:hypothetical protein